jgi:DNA-binding transcriptional regulator YdaS (Cro superfamily)
MDCKNIFTAVQIHLQEKNMTPQEALHKVIAIVGSQSRLAREIGGGITQAHVHYWLTQAMVVPAEYCPSIEHIVNKAVRCEDLNPRVDWWVLRS